MIDISLMSISGKPNPIWMTHILTMVFTINDLVMSILINGLYSFTTVTIWGVPQIRDLPNNVFQYFVIVHSNDEWMIWDI